MICPKCKKQTDDNGNICSYCGSVISEQIFEAEVSPEPEISKKPNKKLIIAITSAILIIAAIIGILLGLHFAEERKSDPTDTVKQENVKPNESSKYTLVENGYLTVAVNADYKPFVFYDENGNIVGFDADFVTAAAEKLGLQIKFVTLPFDRLCSAVSSGKADIAISGFIATDESQKIVDISDSYISVGVVYNGTITTENYVIAIRKNTGLLVVINNIINEFTADGVVESLVEKYNLSNDFDDAFKDVSLQPDIDSLDLPEKMDYNGKQVILNKIGHLNFVANQKEQTFIITNSAQNENVCFMKYSIYIDTNGNGKIDEVDMLIYASELVQPSYSLTSIVLSETLGTGEYNAIVLEQAYSFDKQLTPINSQEIEAVITVK